MSDSPIKCASKEFKAEPFYILQRNGNDTRYVASWQDKQRIKSFLLYFINASSHDFQIKIRDHDHPELKEFYGIVGMQQLIETLDLYEDVIFHDGFHELIIRRSDGEYLAFDEHGLLFIYTGNDYSLVFDKLNLPLKSHEKLIYEFNHWHIQSSNGKEDLKRLIKHLHLK